MLIKKMKNIFISVIFIAVFTNAQDVSIMVGDTSFAGAGGSGLVLIAYPS